MRSNTATFEILTARDYLTELIIPQYDDFKGNNASQRHALLAIMLVYHMYDWVHPKSRGQGSSFSKQHFAGHYPDDTRMAARFDLARRICNGTKHFTCRDKARTSVQAGFSSDFSHDFARPLNVEFDDGQTESVDIFLGKMVGFWKRVIDREQADRAR